MITGQAALDQPGRRPGWQLLTGALSGEVVALLLAYLSVAIALGVGIGLFGRR